MALLLTWHNDTAQTEEVEVVQRKVVVFVLSSLFFFLCVCVCVLVQNKKWDFQISTACFSHKFSVIIVDTARKQLTVDTN